ncbi:hypothetical protein BG015_002584 [Linnemannia schmuckeri]|uniref:CHCH domain-containing protein n=1 Tax=Linnemannia schmuckeri TaxID=64567 RepID=A0A9P5RNT5_9FUNG|nr:hypothetical protein BG015_002584 [Linnemannia schmuckeri]
MSNNEAQQQSDQSISQEDPDWAPTPRVHTQYQRRPSESKPSTSNTSKSSGNKEEKEEEEEEDEYEKRIERTGCAVENEALQLCYAEKHDWRACKDAMEAFRECWKRNGNVQAE